MINRLSLQYTASTRQYCTFPIWSLYFTGCKKTRQKWRLGSPAFRGLGQHTLGPYTEVSNQLIGPLKSLKEPFGRSVGFHFKLRVFWHHFFLPSFLQIPKVIYRPTPRTDLMSVCVGNTQIPPIIIPSQQTISYGSFKRQSFLTKNFNYHIMISWQYTFARLKTNTLNASWTLKPPAYGTCNWMQEKS